VCIIPSRASLLSGVHGPSIVGFVNILFWRFSRYLVPGGCFSLFSLSSSASVNPHLQVGRFAPDPQDEWCVVFSLPGFRARQHYGGTSLLQFIQKDCSCAAILVNYSAITTLSTTLQDLRRDVFLRYVKEPRCYLFFLPECPSSRFRKTG